MRVWLSLATLFAAIVLATMPVEAMRTHGGFWNSEPATISDDHAAHGGRHDHGHRHQDHRGCDLIGAAGCSSWAQALAATGNWHLLRPSWAFRFPTETHTRDSVAIAPPKRPPRPLPVI